MLINQLTKQKGINMQITIEALEKAFQVEHWRACLAYGVIEGEFPLKRRFIEQQEWLEALLPVTAKWIRSCYNMPTVTEIKLAALNELLETFGVETIHPEGDEMFTDVWCEYLNAGDTYTTTLCYLRRGFGRDGGEFILSCWGDELEAMEAEIAKQNEEG